MRMFEPTMAAQIDIFIQNLLSSVPGAEPVDMSQRCKWLGYDIVGLLGFGFPLHVQTEPRHRFILRGLVAGNYKANAFMQFPRLQQTGVETLLHGLSNSSRTRFLSVMDHMVSTRLSQVRDARTDLISFVAEGAEGNALDDAQLRELLYMEGICKELTRGWFRRNRLLPVRLERPFRGLEKCCRLQLADH